MVKSKKNILLVLHYCMVLALLVCCHNGRASSGESRIDEINRLAAERRCLEVGLGGDKLNKFVAASDRPYKVSNSVHDSEEETESEESRNKRQLPSERLTEIINWNKRQGKINISVEKIND